jgi:hypothetical protein
MILRKGAFSGRFGGSLSCSGSSAFSGSFSFPSSASFLAPDFSASSLCGLKILIKHSSEH